MKVRIILAALCCFALVLPANAQQINSAAAQLGHAPMDVSAIATPLDHDGYIVGAGDQVQITVYGEPELTGQYLIGADGAIAFALVGDVPVEGLSTEEIAANLTERLEQGFVLEPRVSVGVVTYRPFYILGEVQRPGAYPFAPDLTVMAAVATAGGFTYRANKRRVYIKRIGEEEQRLSLDGNTRVAPGDTLRIAERLF